MYDSIEAQFLVAYGEFSKVELSEAFLSLASNLTANTAVMTSFVSAYLLIAYLLGERLTMIQKSTVTFLYVVIMTTSLLSFWADLTLGTYLSSKLYQEPANYWFANLVVVSYISIFTVSLYYMFATKAQRDA